MFQLSQQTDENQMLRNETPSQSIEKINNSL